jgi:hypothetical protein
MMVIFGPLPDRVVIGITPSTAVASLSLSSAARSSQR